jgi:hypothetical protein
MHNATESGKLDLMQGLSHLMRPGKGSRRLWMHLDECHDYVVSHESHPFDLPLIPSPLEVEMREFKFVGAHATDMSVMVFLAHIRFWIDFPDGNRLSGLRVINTQAPGGSKEQHQVFFEIQTQHASIISGETNDYTGAGNSARTELENVFAVLSFVYGMEIHRVEVPRVPLNKLYQESVPR